MQQQRHHRPRQLAALLTWCFCWLIVLPASADDAAQVDHYLQRLGLTDLQLIHQEQQLGASESEADGTARARRLSDLYAQRMLAAADEPQRFADLVKRVERLIRDYPAVDSPQLQVMLLQAEYQRAEAKAIAWMDDPANDGPRREAHKLLERLLPQLTARREELAKAIDELHAKADAAEEVEQPEKPKRRKTPTTALSLEQELARLQSVMPRALFFEGWGNFFFGLVEDSSEAALRHFAASEQAFAQLLEVGTEGPLELEPGTMGLESVWRSRSLLGLAAALASLGKAEQAREAFTALTHPATAAAVRDTALYWHLLALVGSKRYAEAQELAAGEFSRFSGGAAGGRTSACVLLVRIGWSGGEPSPERERLARIGLEGLARLKQFDALSALVAKYRPEPKVSDGFYALWGKGRLAFAEAEKSKRDDDFRAASKWFTDALELPQAKDDPVAAAQCRYSLAWCHYRLKDYEAAIRLFRQAATQLKTLGDDSAVQSAWMVFTCYQRLSADAKDTRHQKEAMQVLVNLKRDFPGTEQAQKADLLLARLSATTDSPETAVKTLAAITPDSPNYLAARYELCVARHQLWSKSRGDARVSLGKEVRRDVDAYLAAAPQSEGTRRIRAALLAIDVLLSDDEPDWSAAAGYLSRLGTAPDKLSDDDPIAPEFHYRRLQLAQNEKRDREVRREADWLSKHAAGTPYELPGLVIVARDADEALAAASDEEKSQRRAAAIEAYSRLVKLLGESSEVLAGKKNALVANSKLAQHEFDAGRFSQAAARLEEIVTAFPSDRNYLRRAGLAWIRAGDYAKALPHWDKLAAGSNSTSDAWYEAKFYQLTCLAKTDPAAAAKVWRQFKLLHPEVKSASWQTKFTDLSKQFLAD